MRSAPRSSLPRPEPLDLTRAALFLDLDGTLAPIAERPEAVAPDARRNRLLQRLERDLGGRLAVVSGRTLESIDHILDGAVRAAAGVHGLQRRRADGEILCAAPSPGLVGATEALKAFAAVRQGVLVEDKGLGVALHYRQAPDEAEAALALGEQLAAASGLRLQRGDMVVELRTPGADKGSAIAAFLSEPPFAGALPVFVGDDLTDEDGFRAASRLGGLSVLVGARQPTAAEAGLDDVEDVLTWLETALRPVAV